MRANCGNLFKGTKRKIERVREKQEERERERYEKRKE